MAFRLSEGTREMKRSLYGSRPAAYNIYNRYELINNVETSRGNRSDAPMAMDAVNSATFLLLPLLMYIGR